MSTQMIVGAIGAVIGFFIGGPAGAQVGWVVGTMVGTLLTPGQKGPRLSDTQVQISSYGASLPLVYGGTRLAGNVIWSSDLIESANEQDSKGGPSITTYSYSVNCAVAIAGRPIGGVRKIWADAKLVYDISEDAEGSTQAASAAFASYLAVYLGTEDQMPDPTIEAAEGAGNVEPYRGVAYVVFTGIPLADFGNRIPNFTFEITDADTVESSVVTAAPLVIDAWSTDDAPAHSRGPTSYQVIGAPEPNTFDTLAAATARLAEVYPGYEHYQGFYTSAREVPNEGVMDIFPGGAEELNSFRDGTGAAQCFLAFNITTPDVVSAVSGEPWAGENGTVFPAMYRAGYTYLDGKIYSLLNGTPGGGNRCLAVGFLGGGAGSPPSGFTDWELDKVELYHTRPDYWFGDPPPPGLPRIAYSLHQFIVATRVLAPPANTCGPGDPCLDGIAQIPGNPAFCLNCAGEVSPNNTYTRDDGAYRQLRALSGIDIDGGYTQVPVGPAVRSDDPRYSDGDFWTEQAALAGIPGVYPTNFPVDVAAAAIGTPMGIQETEAGSILLSDIVTDICLRADLLESEIDVSELTDTLLGFKVSRQMPGRSALEPLRQAYYFDAVESGRVIRFVKRGGAVAATIGPDDLGVTEDSQSGPLVRRTRAQESELPAVVNVAYECRDADYETGAQSARRSTSVSVQEIGVELPIVLTDQRAAEVADVLLYDAWSGRVRSEWVTTRAFANLEPTDVVDISDGEFNYQILITDKTEDGPLIRWAGRDEDPAAYSPVVTPSVTSGGGSTVRFDGPMKIEPLDAPLLRNADDGASFLLAGSGYRPTFRGGRLYRSTDDATYESVRDINVAARIGYALNALPDFGGGNTIDEASYLDVRMHSGTLSTITLSALLNEGNACALGVNGRLEILNFQRATLLEEGVYRLTGLLRGRKGTEQHMGGHEIGDHFVLLDPANVYRIEQELGDVGVEAQLKGVAFGTALVDASVIPFTYGGVNLKPLSPVHIRAARRPDTGSVRFTWMRRTRYKTALSPTLGFVAPLGEAAEAYQVDIYADSSRAVVLRTLTSTAEQADYTIENELLDFGALGSELCISVYQISSSIGRGFEGRADLTGFNAPMQRAIYVIDPPAAITSMIDTRVDGAIMYKGLMPPGIGEPNAFLVSTIDGFPFSLNTSSNGWKTTGGSIDTVRVTATGVSYLSTAASNWYNSFGSVLIFLAGSGIFELVEWTGDGTGARDIAHALGVAPALALAKRNAVEDWWMYSDEIGADFSARFPTDAGHHFEADTGAFPDLSTSTNLKIGADLNASGEQYLALLFAGTSAFVESGTYTGNGSGSGPSVSLGFMPALLLVRSLGGTDAHTVATTSALDGLSARHWLLDDRGTSASETSVLTLGADGFSINSTDTDVNENGTSYHYWALKP